MPTNLSMHHLQFSARSYYVPAPNPPPQAFPTSSSSPHDSLLSSSATGVASKSARPKDPLDTSRMAVLAPSLPPEILAKLGYTENTALRPNLAALPSGGEPTLFRPSAAVEPFERGLPPTDSTTCEAASGESEAMARRRLAGPREDIAQADPGDRNKRKPVILVPVGESRIPKSFRVANQQPGTLRANFPPSGPGRTSEEILLDRVAKPFGTVTRHLDSAEMRATNENLLRGSKSVLLPPVRDESNSMDQFPQNLSLHKDAR